VSAAGDRRPAPARHPAQARHPTQAHRPPPARHPVPVSPPPVRRPVHEDEPVAPDEPILTGRPVPPGEQRHYRAASHEPIALVDLLDRVLAGGVVISGEVRLTIADVDLVTVSLRALVSSVSTALGTGPGSEDEAGG
jgi:hypothetical protein